MSTENYIQDCYVAFMDILGFKDIIFKKTKDYIIDIFKEIDAKVIRTSIFQRKEGMEIPLIPQNCLHKKIMSDSIVLFISKEHSNSLLVLLLACTVFQSEMLSLCDPVLLRGGISEGYMYNCGDVLFGEGLTNAYLLESKYAKYPRIIIPKSVCDSYTNPNNIPAYNYLFKAEDDEYYSTDYMRFYLNPSVPKGFIPETKLNEFIDKCLNQYSDASIKEKYLYLQNEILKHTQGE